MKKLFAVALGILTAIGGFVDIGDLVTNGLVGSRFGMSLGWVVIVGIVGICVFAEMSGRVAAVSGRATFDLIRERLGPRMGLANLVASMAVTLLTYIAEIGGVALALQLATSVNPYLWIPVVGAAVWLVLWRVKFSILENAFGLAGLSLIVFAVALWQLGPDWDALWRQASRPLIPHDESHLTYFYYAVGLFGAAMTPYEVFFFSSGGVEEGWKAKDLGTMRANVFIGFPLGGLLSLAIAGCATVVFQPNAIQVDTLGQIALPVTIALGKLGLALVLLGFFAATFGAACETGLSVGYSIAQYFGWQWGKYVEPLRAARFHTVLLVSSIAAVGVLLTTVDPIMLTEYSVVFSAIALPLTYFPILVVANDRTYMGRHVNGRLANGLGSLYLVIVLVAAAAAIPLMVLTKAGQ
ncbi:Mn2+ and Fe2+ transporters of the NRAMP family [Pedococcus dokdonensis]|uniref:Mn2+ and Fe2+ transporters of the NRAMP family n=1 Tax=Pedococcus dokdonensis TaxID=443156 RepID=A0A1H0SQK8_9MICO|nr:divalent metal cation transporter [Pedococcus dokdonensis]SDP43973.1 Mn2+ and Fe2+ transporters of the NRAMP family [Pedococcus dokdonensis]